MDLLIGTTNPGKLREYAALLDGLPVRLLSLRDVNLHSVDIEEPFETFEENALHKAAEYARLSGLLALADDTGLVVDALDGRPGVYSARYAGPGATDRDRYQRILDEMADVPPDQRTARFVCVVAVVSPDAAIREAAPGAVEGRIGFTPGQGREGFGYDAIFIPDGYAVPLSDIPFEEKNGLSHRGAAARALLPSLRQIVGL
jgi:XTP/dITP diphosphohydrolase